MIHMVGFEVTASVRSLDVMYASGHSPTGGDIAMPQGGVSKQSRE